MKNKLASAVCGALLVGGAVGSAQAAEVSANVSMVSDYSFRGMSQTSRDPAIQGGFDVAFDSGFYIGTWSSSVSFGDTSQELDLYAGYSGQINEDLSFDLNYTRFEYPSAGSTYDYNEVAASLSFGNATVGLGYSDEYFAVDDVEWFYPFVDYSFALPNDMSIDLHLGYSIIDGTDEWEAAYGDDDIIDYSAFLTIPVAGIDLGIGVVGTDLDDDFCDKECELRPVVSLSKTL